MTVAETIRSHLPYLRRYARALTGTQTDGDAYVKATLEAIISEPEMISEANDPRTSLYRIFSVIWSSSHIETLPEITDITSLSISERGAQSRLSVITPLSRQALLLSSLENFTTAQISVIVSMPEDSVHNLIEEAIADIERETATDVLIIEDEPLIAMQLEELVASLGHNVSAIAATHKEAIAAIAQKQPGLILADVQLADGSSGIEAVQEILSRFDVPVIFITAFPERLLTGERPEPTFLISKPFSERTVKSAISQAMFLNSTQAELQAA